MAQRRSPLPLWIRVLIVALIAWILLGLNLSTDYAGFGGSTGSTGFPMTFFIDAPEGSRIVWHGLIVDLLVCAGALLFPWLLTRGE